MWNYHQRDRIEKSVDQTERNPPGQPLIHDPRSQILSGASQAFCSIQWNNGTQSVTTTQAELDIGVSDAETTDTSVFSINLVGTKYVRLLKEGLYTIIAPWQACEQASAAYNDTTFTITDDGSTARIFDTYEYSYLHSRISLVDSASTDPWADSSVLSEYEFGAHSTVMVRHMTNNSRDLCVAHTRTFYLSQTEIDQLTDVEVKNLVQHYMDAGTSTFNYYSIGGLDSDMYTEIIYWGGELYDDITTIDLQVATPP